ncbi:MAG: zinc ribbon domain-containing protein [Clostridia bacterium]|nr:zinc ribbon domain-containing protein [Clostridia bacterium]
MADYCSKCGKALNKNSKRCPDCGTKNDVKRKSHAPLIICILLVLALAAAGVYYFGIQKHRLPLVQEKTEPTTETQSAAAIENSELAKLVRESKVPSHINAHDKEMLKNMIASAQSLSYAEISEEQFSNRISGIVGAEIKPDENAFMEYVAEDRDFYYVDAGGEDGQMYLVFGKKNRNMYILSELKNGYWMTENVEKELVADRFSGAEQEKAEEHYVLGKTGETVFYGITVGDWCFYYNDEGNLFLCMNNADESDPLFFNADYQSMEPFAGQLVFQTVLDNIESKYSVKLEF